MRIEIAGAQVTDSVVEVLDILQNNADLVHSYIHTLDYLTRAVILDLSGDDREDATTFSHLRALQLIRRDLLTLATPPDADDPANDNPTASF